MVNEFFVVTETSVYLVQGNDGCGCAVAVKVALKGDSIFGVGHRLSGGSMLAIGKKLIAYVPEGGGLTSFERHIDGINTRYWGDQSSQIIAIFRSQKEALDCIKQPDLQAYDHRWIRETREILREIGDKHPTLYLWHSKSMGLPSAIFDTVAG